MTWTVRAVGSAHESCQQHQHTYLGYPGPLGMPHRLCTTCGQNESASEQPAS